MCHSVFVVWLDFTGPGCKKLRSYVVVARNSEIIVRRWNLYVYLNIQARWAMDLCRLIVHRNPPDYMKKPKKKRQTILHGSKMWWAIELLRVASMSHLLVEFVGGSLINVNLQRCGILIKTNPFLWRPLTTKNDKLSIETWPINVVMEVVFTHF